jgi:2-dehydro-3-deoxyphosphogluconate aldolase/(4S)-4-hydroxy-2-oxoglutarate aldolase
VSSGSAAFATALRRHGIVAILRGVDAPTLAARVRALHGAGIRMIEIALSDPDAVPRVAELARIAPDDMLIGAGTVTSLDLATAAEDAGARFLVTPHLAPDVIAYARERDLGLLAGALTPTEIATVREAGGRFVKLFPASVVGPGYVKALLGPYPDLELVPVGGVGSATAAAYLAAGAVGLGVGGALTAADDPGFSTAAAEAARLTEIWVEQAPARRG